MNKTLGNGVSNSLQVFDSFVKRPIKSQLNTIEKYDPN